MTVQSTIEQKLQQAFTPQHLEVTNESHMHNVPPGSESHFKVVIVSEAFDGQRLIQRHRAVNSLLKTELAEQVHALALHTYTPTQWQAQHGEAPDSPACRGGEG